VIDRTSVRAAALVLALGLNVWTGLRLFYGRPFLAVVSWLASLALLVLASSGKRVSSEPGTPWTKRQWLTRAALICLPALVRLALFRLDRIHGDDILTAYFSATYDLRHADFFAPVPADPGDWVSQFPAPFFVLQKLFFAAFGESLLTIKLSILPYVVVTAGFLFAIARDLVDERAAALAVVVYAFFGPSLYLETLGLHFVSSTAAFLAFFHFAIRELRSGHRRDALIAGLLAGSCYLFYLSSFLALPLAALFFYVRGGALREHHVAGNLLLFVVGVAAVLSPFLADAARHHGGYLRRVEQVALLGGEWSPYRPGGAGGVVPAPRVVSQSLRLSLRSLYTPGIGGHGGYDFGKQALLEPLALALAMLGALRAITLARRCSEWWLVLITIALAFLMGVVLTIPPPAFHRLSIAFPFVALLISLPLHAVINASVASRALRHAGAALLLAGLVLTQHLYFLRAALAENDPVALRLARFIDTQFPGRRLYVAAYPSYAFEKIYRFATQPPPRRVTSDTHGTLLPRLDVNRKYVYVVTLPDAFDAQFASRDPRGRIIRFAPEYSLFVN
jgi:drug/metabolite transporter superfamily protein YnfA